MDFSFNPYYEEKFEFYDRRLLNLVQEGDDQSCMFFKLLALCHTVMPEEKDGKFPPWPPGGNMPHCHARGERWIVPTMATRGQYATLSCQRRKMVSSHHGHQGAICHTVMPEEKDGKFPPWPPGGNMPHCHARGERW